MSEETSILLVEDDTNDVALIRRALAKAGIVNPVSVVDNGEDAVAYLTARGPSADRASHPMPGLVLLDLKLPRKSGLEVLEWMKVQPRLKRVPVVVLTSSNRRSDVDRAYDLGANSYLKKPVTFDALVEMVRVLGLYWIGFNEGPSGPA